MIWTARLRTGRVVIFQASGSRAFRAAALIAAAAVVDLAAGIDSAVAAGVDLAAVIDSAVVADLAAAGLADSAAVAAADSEAGAEN